VPAIWYRHSEFVKATPASSLMIDFPRQLTHLLLMLQSSETPLCILATNRLYKLICINTEIKYYGFAV